MKNTKVGIQFGKLKKKIKKLEAENKKLEVSLGYATYGHDSALEVVRALQKDIEILKENELKLLHLVSEQKPWYKRLFQK